MPSEKADTTIFWTACSAAELIFKFYIKQNQKNNIIINNKPQIYKN